MQLGAPDRISRRWRLRMSLLAVSLLALAGLLVMLLAGTPHAHHRVAPTRAVSPPAAPPRPQAPAATHTTHATHPTHGPCFASPGRCGFPDPAVGNVGVPAGTALSSSASLTVSTPGGVIQNLDVAGQITVAASNVTIRNVRVTVSGGSGAWGIFINKGASGTTIVDSTVRGAGSSDPNSIESAVWNHYDEPSTTGIRDYFYNCGDCWEGSGTIDDSYMVVNGLFSGAHYEDIYVCSSSVTANHDTLLNPQGQTATVFGDTICGGGNQFTVTNSLLAGGGFLLYPAANSSSVGSTSMTVTGNRFARCLGSPVYNSESGGTACTGGADVHGYYPNGGYFGSSAYMYCPPTGKQTWSNNVWDDNNAAVKCATA